MATKLQAAPDIVRDAIQRVTGDPHQARREVVQAVLDDLASAGLTIRRKPLWRRLLRAGLLRLADKLAPPETATA